MTHKKLLAATVAFCLAWSGCPLALGQSSDQQRDQSLTDGTGESNTASAVGDSSLRYEVVAVKGNVRISQIGLDPKQTEGWSKVQIGDLLGAGLQIHVPFRGAVKLTARPSEPPTVILIERGSLVAITELMLDPRQNAAKSRVKLAYGAVRAGVAEGDVRSDMEIESPVATLSKRGTDIFRFEYYDGRFRMELSEQGRGLIQAIQTRGGSFGSLDRTRSHFLTPGQFVTQQMMRAIENVQFDRTVNFNDAFGLGELDMLFTMNNGSGLGALLPVGSSNVANFMDSPTSTGQIGVLPEFEPSTMVTTMSFFTQQLQLRTRHDQRSGDFGIGQSGLPSLTHPNTQTSRGIVTPKQALQETQQTWRQLRKR